jgi:predicted KAP-like P-loop ATPase
MYFNDNETAVDLLQYEPIAKSVVALIKSAGTSPISIGLHGDWGAGKSSVLAMVQLHLSGEKKILCLRFNGWAFQGFEDAKLVILESLVSEISDARPASAKVKAQAKALFKRIDWLKVAKRAGSVAFVAATGIPTPETFAALADAAKAIVKKGSNAVAEGDAAGLISSAGEFLKEAEADSSNVPREIHEFRKDFKTLLAEAEIDQLVILVDDLDRCLPNTIIETLEAIRLFLFVERSAFVVAVDETMVEYAVRQHFPDLPSGIAPHAYARNYLEKLIQVPFRIPALGPAETRTYITLLLIERQLSATDFAPFLELARRLLTRPWISSGLDRTEVEKQFGKVQPEIEPALMLAAQLTALLNDGTKGNPRQIKRFLNSLLLRESIAEARGFKDAIKRPILAKLMLLERFALDEYEQLVTAAAGATGGKVLEFKSLEKTNADEGGAKLAEPEGVFATWRKNPVVTTWLALSPPLADIDLRPYAFITRDKRSLSGMVGGLGALEGLYEKLKAGGLSASAESKNVAKLVEADAQKIFSVLKEDAFKEDSWQNKPKEMEALLMLAKGHPRLQTTFVEMLKARPVDKLGPWVVSGWKDAISEPNAREGYVTIFRGWMSQTANKPLQSAAKATAKIVGIN